MPRISVFVFLLLFVGAVVILIEAFDTTCHTLDNRDYYGVVKEGISACVTIPLYDRTMKFSVAPLSNGTLVVAVYICGRSSSYFALLPNSSKIFYYNTIYAYEAGKCNTTDVTEGIMKIDSEDFAGNMTYRVFNKNKTPDYRETLLLNAIVLGMVLYIGFFILFFKYVCPPEGEEPVMQQDMEMDSLDSNDDTSGIIEYD